MKIFGRLFHKFQWFFVDSEARLDITHQKKTSPTKKNDKSCCFGSVHVRLEKKVKKQGPPKHKTCFRLKKIYPIDFEIHSDFGKCYISGSCARVFEPNKKNLVPIICTTKNILNIRKLQHTPEAPTPLVFRREHGDPFLLCDFSVRSFRGSGTEFFLQRKNQRISGPSRFLTLRSLRFEIPDISKLPN